ncbi:DNA helicase rad5 [Tulasnella sp. 403]|nr:DNA helicase rad5 [Tulasnella sp. 403]
MALNPDNPLQLYTSSLDGTIKLWDWLEGVILHSWTMNRPTMRMAFHSSLPHKVFVAFEPRETSHEISSSVCAVGLETASQSDRDTNAVEIDNLPNLSALAVSTSGRWLIALAGRYIRIAMTSQPSRGFTKLASEQPLTSLAFHPKNDSFATGDVKGVIRLWFSLTTDEIPLDTRGERVQGRSTTLHWHPHPVGALSFSPDGSYLLSGGLESVLVVWQLHTNHRGFLPRVGAPIKAVTSTDIAGRGHCILLVLADGELALFDSNRQRICSRSDRLKRSNPSTSFIAAQRHHKWFAIASSHPSSVQIYSVQDNARIAEVEVVPSNLVPHREQRTLLAPAVVSQVDFDECADWMATTDHQSDESNGSNHLKFWRRSADRSFVLNTVISRPHEGKIVLLRFSPRRSSTNAVLATAGLDGTVKTWCINDIWLYRASLSYRGQIPVAMEFSPDASLLAVAFGSSVTLWTTTSFGCLQNTCSLTKAPASLCFVGLQAQVLAILGGDGVVVLWDIAKDLIRKEQHPTVKPSLEKADASFSCLVPDPRSNRFTVIQSFASVTLVRVYDLSSPIPLRSQRISVGFRTLCPLTYESPSLVGVTPDGLVGYLGVGGHEDYDDDKGKGRHSLAEAGGRSSLFENVFGRSAFIQPGSSDGDPAPLMEKNSDKLMSERLLDGPASLVPPLEALFPSLMEGVLTKPCAGEGLETGKGAERQEDSLPLDDSRSFDEYPEQRKRSTPRVVDGQEPNFFGSSDEEMDDLSNAESIPSEILSRFNNPANCLTPSPVAHAPPTQQKHNGKSVSPIILDLPPAKKRRLPSSSSVHINVPSDLSGSAVGTSPRTWYLGEMVVADAWATTNGSRLCAGDTVHIYRECPSDRATPSHTRGSKVKRKDAKLTSLMRKQLPKPSKSAAEKNTIVRFSNCEHQENVFILPSASLMYSHGHNKSRDAMPEGAETIQENELSERKASLTTLFEALSLRPSHRAASHDVGTALAFTRDKNRSRNASSKMRKEIVGEGSEAEEVEVEGEELTVDQLEIIYQKAQKHDLEMPGMDPSATFTLTLRPYQRQALKWMSSIENGSNDARDADSMHPLWEEYHFPPEPYDGVIDLCQDEEPFYFNPYSGELSLEYPRAELSCRGGILADESEQTGDLDSWKPKQSSLFSKPLGTKRQISTASLIVAPLSLLSQWKAELDRSSKRGSIKTSIYHGTDKVNILLCAPDDQIPNVIITNYDTLRNEHAKTLRGAHSPLYHVEWLRVVLDEAHYIKSRTSTPIVNRLEDLHSLLRFLKDEPWSDFAFFKSCITTPFLRQDPKCLDVVQVILESILLRREKSTKDRNGDPIVSLPPKEVNVEMLEFSPAERKIYDSIYADAKHTYEAFYANGAVGRNMSNILAMLMRLRQAVLHPSLVQSRSTSSDKERGVVENPMVENSLLDVEDMIAQFRTAKDGANTASEPVSYPIEVLKHLGSLDRQECSLCLDTVQEPVIIPECHHVGCKECIVDLLEDQEAKGVGGSCPVCRRQPVMVSSLIEVRIGKPMPDQMALSTSIVTLRTNDFVSSTKLDALVKHLRHLHIAQPTFRAVIFSQFTRFLDLIQLALRREGFEEYRLDGQVPQARRTRTLQEFAEPSDSPKVLAVSLRAGGVGLNLTQANHVFMMDSWWNSAVEQQAIDRVHRIGQDKTVHVVHFVIARTIEERILAIQKRKTAIVRGALGGNKESDHETFDNLKIMFSS